MLCLLRRRASAHAAVARWRLGGARGCSEVVERRLWVGRGRFPNVEEPRRVHSRFRGVGFPSREPGWDLQAFPETMGIRTPSQDASLEPLLTLPAACQNLSRRSQSQCRERSAPGSPSAPAGPETILGLHIHHQLPDIRPRWRVRAGQSLPSCPGSAERRGSRKGKLESRCSVWTVPLSWGVSQ